MLTSVVALRLGLLLSLLLSPSSSPSPRLQNQNQRYSKSDPCVGISVQAWQDVPSNRITVDPNFDAGVPADYASLWTGQDGLYMYPNGFRKGQVYENNDPPFCFYVPSVRNKQVQIMIQTVDSQARLCLKDTVGTQGQGGTAMGGAIDRCFTGSTTACFGGYSYNDYLSFVVYTDSTAATTATPFWYRVRTSAVSWSLSDSDASNSAISTLEMWCMRQYTRDTTHTRLPSETFWTRVLTRSLCFSFLPAAEQDQQPLLMRFPKELRSVVPPASKQTVQGAATSQSVSIVSVLALAVATVAAIFRQ